MTEQMPCGCCAGTTAQTPATIDNRAGLSAIAYRSGTWAQFKASMLDALSTTPALAGLQTRSDDDFTIALLDSWAVICDILTFYTERIANESYLRTATELVSVGELAKLIGYKLRPGVAASAALSFTMDTPLLTPPGPSNPPTGSPTSIALGTGTQAQTVPDPGAQPATFETVAPICARAEWNAITPCLTLPPAPAAANAGANVRLASLATAVKVGDSLLVAAADAPHCPQLQQVASVEQDTTTKTTVINFGPGVPQQSTAPPPTAQGTAAAGRVARRHVPVEQREKRRVAGSGPARRVRHGAGLVDRRPGGRDQRPAGLAGTGHRGPDQRLRDGDRRVAVRPQRGVLVHDPAVPAGRTRPPAGKATPTGMATTRWPTFPASARAGR